MSASAERYHKSHSTATQKPKRVARHQRRMARKAAKRARWAARKNRK